MINYFKDTKARFKLCALQFTQNQDRPACKMKKQSLWGDKPGFIQVHNARGAREPQRGQAGTCLRTKKENQPMAVSSVRKEVCIQTGQLKQVYAGWHRGSRPSPSFSWWEALWGQFFAMGIHSNSDSIGR